jgi:hypothetical protein
MPAHWRLVAVSQAVGGALTKEEKEREDRASDLADLSSSSPSI